jgi:hypothetical protein
VEVIHRITLAVNGAKRIIYMGLALAGAVMFLSSDARATPSGTSSLHFTFKSAMTNTGVEPDASGNVNGTLIRRGNTTNQQLKVSLAKLRPLTTYQLAAFIGDDAVNSTSVTNITTDSKGDFKVRYMENTRGNASAGKHPLPAALNPLNNIRELDIVNSTTQTVLQVNLTNTTDKLQYLFKGPMDNTGLITNAVGSLQIKGTTTSTQIRLTASGLTPNADYVLMINGNAGETNAATHAGKLKLTAQLSTDVLEIKTVTLSDITSNLVLAELGIPTGSQASVDLGAASTFAIIASASIAGGGDTITGNVGLTPGSAQGIDPSEINGTIDVNNLAASAAQTALVAADKDLYSRSTGAISLPGNLGGLTLTPGLYVNSSSVEILGTGANAILTLDAQGDANAVFIFKMASTFTMGTGTSIVLSGGAQAKNVFWQVGSSATLDTTSIFKGNILANASITVNNGAVVTGRLFAGSGGGTDAPTTGSVTVQSSTVTVPSP